MKMEKEKDYCDECEQTFHVEELFFGYWATLCKECKKELGYTE